MTRRVRDDKIVGSVDSAMEYFRLVEELNPGKIYIKKIMRYITDIQDMSRRLNEAQAQGNDFIVRGISHSLEMLILATGFVFTLGRHEGP